MPDPALLTPLGIAMRDSLPPFLRDDPDYLGAIHAVAKEVDAAEAAIEQARAQFNPAAADILLSAWETITRRTVGGGGATTAQRQAAVTARLRKALNAGEGRAWEQNVTDLVGPGWDYKEHVEGDATTPPAGWLRIVLPFPPSGSRYAEAAAQIRDISPAHLELEFESSGGFVLDESQMDVEGMGV